MLHHSCTYILGTSTAHNINSLVTVYAPVVVVGLSTAIRPTLLTLKTFKNQLNRVRVGETRQFFNRVMFYKHNVRTRVYIYVSVVYDGIEIRTLFFLFLYYVIRIAVRISYVRGNGRRRA